MADGGGLYLLVKPNGGWYWRLDYRHTAKRKILAFGLYPGTSLAEAREKRAEAKKLLQHGTDPAAQRKRKRREAQIAALHTFKALADEYIAKLEREGRATATISKKRWLLDLVKGDLGARQSAM